MLTLWPPIFLPQTELGGVWEKCTDQSPSTISKFCSCWAHNAKYFNFFLCIHILFIEDKESKWLYKIISLQFNKCGKISSAF